MNRMELDGFVAEVGFNCNSGGDEKWQGTKVESLITQKVQQLSRLRSRMAGSVVGTVNSCAKVRGSAEATVTCREAR